MPSDAGGREDRSVPRLAPGWEAEAVGLNPAEGFLLSRIDGHTSWAVLREIGGLSPEEVDLALEAWVSAGWVLLDSSRGYGALVAERKPGPPPAAPAAPAPEPDPGLDLDPALQRRIFDLDARLDALGYHELLGIGRGADAREIKRAYFQLSKQFHPDRYFRRNIGDHARRLDRIFRRLVEAYELLSDPTTRSEIERSMAVAPPAQAPAADPESPAPVGYRTPTRMENLARLRRSFGSAENVLAERRFRARQFYRAAQSAAGDHRWLEAAASARLAIAFDPWNAEFKRGFASIQGEVHAMRAVELLEASSGVADPAEALEALEEAICYRPADAALLARAAELALRAGDLDTASEYADRVCEVAPEAAAHHLLSARVQRRAGNCQAALRALDSAARLAPKDPEIEAERRRLGRGR